jgi:Major Facilitator Superfamily
MQNQSEPPPALLTRSDAARTARRAPQASSRSDAAFSCSPLAWLPVAVALAGTGRGSNQITPMLLVYRHTLALGTGTLEAMFGFYALGLIPGLLLAGPLSDARGRRTVVIAAAWLSLLASAVLVAGADSVALLFLGRLMAGVSSGAVFAAGTAWLREISLAPTGTATPHGAARRAATAMTAGFALGPLVAGMLAQWAPASRTLPYLPHIAFTALVLLALLNVPETVSGTRRHPIRLSVPAVRSARFRARPGALADGPRDRAVQGDARPHDARRVPELAGVVRAGRRAARAGACRLALRRRRAREDGRARLPLDGPSDACSGVRAPRSARGGGSGRQMCAPGDDLTIVLGAVARARLALRAEDADGAEQWARAKLSTTRTRPTSRSCHRPRRRRHAPDRRPDRVLTLREARMAHDTARAGATPASFESLRRELGCRRVTW